MPGGSLELCRVGASAAVQQQRARFVFLREGQRLHQELGDIAGNDDATGPAVVTTLSRAGTLPLAHSIARHRLESYKHLTGDIATEPGPVV